MTVTVCRVEEEQTSSFVVHSVGVDAFNVVVKVASMESGQALDWDVKVSGHTHTHTHTHTHHTHARTHTLTERQ